MNSLPSNGCIQPSPSPDGRTRLYASPPRLSEPLRVLLLVPEMVPAWIATFIGQAREQDWLDVQVLAISGTSVPRVVATPLDMRGLLAFERRRRLKSTALELVDITRGDKAVSSATRLQAESPAIELRLAQVRPDLVLTLGPLPCSKRLADLTPWGCWNIDASLLDPVAAGLSLLAPVLQDDAATPIELELQVHRSWRAPISLSASYGATHFGSFTQQRERAFLKLPMLLLRTMRRIAANELDVPRHHVAELRLKSSPVPGRMGAGARALATHLLRTALWQLRKRRAVLPWVLVMRRDAEPLDPKAPEVRLPSVIAAKPGDYWADPCVVDAAGRALVFVEEVTPSGKGTVACLELESGKVRRLGLAIEEPGHLSFPQVFQQDGTWYMTLESSAQKRVSLYRASDFPLGWRRVVDLVTDRFCLDPILHFHEGRWYLFATVSENRNSTWDELFLFFSDELTGPFQPHPANPILSDVRRARPAGRLFQYGSKLIRPSQDCASGYGSAVVFNEVLEMTPERYSEQTMSRLKPYWSDSLVACHTYSAAAGVEFLDARGYRLSSIPGSDRNAVDGGSAQRVPPIPAKAARETLAPVIPPKGAA